MGDLRLAGGEVSEVTGAEYGRLEIFSNGGWGAVCHLDGSPNDPNRQDNIFSDASAAVACRQLGFSDGVKMDVIVRAATGMPFLLCYLNITLHRICLIVTVAQDPPKLLICEIPSNC